MCLSLAAERGTRAAQKEMAGMVSSFALMVGLSAGSALGLALSHYVAPAGDGKTHWQPHIPIT